MVRYVFTIGEGAKAYQVLQISETPFAGNVRIQGTSFLRHPAMSNIFLSSYKIKLEIKDLLSNFRFMMVTIRLK
jgi:hypothetical protein